MSVELRPVSEDEADIRLDRWFRRHFPSVTQGVIQKFCRTGQIRVDGKRAEAATRLAPGQVVRVPPLPTPQPGEEPEPAPRRAPDPALVREMERLVLYRDAHLIVLDKPFGVPTQGGPGIVRHIDGMLDGLRTEEAGRPRLVHRLDRDTTGALVVARTPGVAARLAAAFRTRAVEKTYWAVVVGRLLPLVGRIEAPLVRLDGFKGERAAVAGPYDTDVAQALTDYAELDHAGKKLAWLELKPLTGRTHQLRVHCAGAGVPILGDVTYGTEKDGRNSAIVDGFATQLHLHARRLVLPHPAGGTLAVEAPLPAHMAATFKDLGFDAAPAKAPLRR